MRTLASIVACIIGIVGAARAETLCLVDGAVLSDSWCVQNSTITITVGSPNNMTANEAAKVIQLFLTSVGMDPGPIDGVIGPATLGAIVQYKRKNGYPADREITKEFMSMLTSDVQSRSQMWLNRNQRLPSTNNQGNSDPSKRIVVPPQVAVAAAKMAKPAVEEVAHGLKALVVLVLAGGAFLVRYWIKSRNGQGQTNKLPPPDATASPIRAQWNAQRAATWTAIVGAGLFPILNPELLGQFTAALAIGDEAIAAGIVSRFVLFAAFWAAAAVGICKLRNRLMKGRPQDPGP